MKWLVYFTTSLLLNLNLLVSGAPSDHERNATVYFSEAEDKHYVKFDVVDEAEGLCVGTFADGLEVDGWGVLRVKTSGNFHDMDQMYAAGFVEGALTAKRIYEHFHNLNDFFFSSTNATELIKVKDFFRMQEQWTRKMIDENREDGFWRQMGLIQSQFDGLVDGYSMYHLPGQGLDRFAFYILNGAGDLLDLKTALIEAEKENWDSFMEPDAGKRKDPMEAKLKVALSNRCTALIKVLPDLSDIFFAHSTWFTYSAMNRIYKHYNFAVKEQTSSSKKMSFSSYPGSLESQDDFYIMDSHLAVIQTTNSIFNTTLYEKITPHSLFSWQRVRIANSMANGGRQWASVFQKYNSGTYNNQYMVVDLNKFRQGELLMDDLLWVIEQIPGYVDSKDVTEVLRNGYWASWNVPYFKKIYQMSGYPTFVSQHGLDFSYQMAPRAEIFRRDSQKVKDFSSLKWMMRYNEYKVDRFSEKSPMDTICARGDLNKGHPVYFGCSDTKVSSYKRALRLLAEAVNGPTTQDEPPFRWSQQKAVNVKHEGQPDEFNFGFKRMDPRWEEF